MLSCLVEVAYLDAVYGARAPVYSDISRHLEVGFARTATIARGE
jgi:hypothetical protein